MKKYNIYLDDELYMIAKDYTKYQEMSFSSWVRRIIKAELRRRGKLSHIDEKEALRYFMPDGTLRPSLSKIVLARARSIAGISNAIASATKEPNIKPSEK